MPQLYLKLLVPLYTYNHARNAYVLRGVGRQMGPVLCSERRLKGQPDRRAWSEQRREALEPGEIGDRRRGRRSSLA